MNYKYNYVKLLSLQSKKNYYYTLKFNKPISNDEITFYKKNNFNKVKSFSNNLDAYNICLLKKNHILLHPQNINSIYNIPNVELVFTKKPRLLNNTTKYHLFKHLVNNQILLQFEKANIIQKWYKKKLFKKQQQQKYLKNVNNFSKNWYNNNLKIVCDKIKEKEKLNKLINKLYIKKKLYECKKYKELCENYCIYNEKLELDNLKTTKNILESGILMKKNNINYIIKYNDLCLEIINCKNNKEKCFNINNINYIIAKNSNEIIISYQNVQYIYNILPFYRNLIINYLDNI